MAESALLYPGSPNHFHVDPARLFDRPALLEIELGAGKGEFIIERAATTPERNFIAIELATPVVRMLALRVAQSGLANLKVVQADARTIVNLLLPNRCVEVFHIYFPDPWPKERHAKHRLFTPYLVGNLGRTLSRDGMAYFASDVRDYADAAYEMFRLSGFRDSTLPVPGAHRSNFGRKYVAEGREVFAGAFLPPEMGGAKTDSYPQAERDLLTKVSSFES